MDRGITLSTQEKYELGFTIDRYGEAITIPYFNPPPYNSIRFVRLRWLDPNAPHKYHTPRGKGSHIYNVRDVDQPNVYITEGEFDCLILKQMGLASIAIPGTHTFRPEWAYLFVNTESVTVVADGDEPGEAAAMRIASIIGPYTDVSVAKMPSGDDVNSLYLKDVIQLGRLLDG